MKKVTEYVEIIFNDLKDIDVEQLEKIYHSVKKSGIIIPSGEGRAKGALSIGVSEMAKSRNGKIVIDRSDIGFPGRTISEAAPILKKRYGHISLLINSSSGQSLVPLLDAQNFADYITSTENKTEYSIDIITSKADSPLARLSSKYGNMLVIKTKGLKKTNFNSAFKTTGIIEDTFSLSSGVLINAFAIAINREKSASEIPKIIQELKKDVKTIVTNEIKSNFFQQIINILIQKRSCFFAGLGSSQEVARISAVRLGHIKLALGDNVYVAGETTTPSPRSGDLLIAISGSGETEIISGWCRNFKKMGGIVASITGKKNNTVKSLSNYSIVIDSQMSNMEPNDFYIKAAFVLSPLPIFFVDKLEEMGITLPEYITKWRKSIIK